MFVRVEGSKPVAGADEAPTSAGVALLQNGKELANEMISLAAGQSQRIVFPVETAGAGHAGSASEAEGFDALASDNVAYLDLPVGRPTGGLLSPSSSNRTGTHCEAIKNVVLYPSDEGESKAASYDLVISDRKADADLEAATFVFVGVIPDDLAKLVRIEETLAQVIDWQRSTPLLQHVLLTDVQIADRPVSAEGVRDRDYEDLGYEILAQGRTGPLVLRKETGRPHGHVFAVSHRPLDAAVSRRLSDPGFERRADRHAAGRALGNSRRADRRLAAAKPEARHGYKVRRPNGSIPRRALRPTGPWPGVACPDDRPVYDPRGGHRSRLDRREPPDRHRNVAGDGRSVAVPRVVGGRRRRRCSRATTPYGRSCSPRSASCCCSSNGGIFSGGREVSCAVKIDWQKISQCRKVG